MSERDELFDLYLRRLDEAGYVATEPGIRYLQEDINVISFISYVFDQIRAMRTNERG